MDYGYPERRKNRNDKRAKRKFNKYKSGGRFRSFNMEMKSSEEKRGQT